MPRTQGQGWRRIIWRQIHWWCSAILHKCPLHLQCHSSAIFFKAGRNVSTAQQSFWKETHFPTLSKMKNMVEPQEVYEYTPPGHHLNTPSCFGLFPTQSSIIEERIHNPEQICSAASGLEQHNVESHPFAVPNQCFSNFNQIMYSYYHPASNNSQLLLQQQNQHSVFP